MEQVLTIPFSIGEKVYIINELFNRGAKKYEWNVLEGIVECLHIGRKLSFHGYVTDSYLKARSTMTYSLISPIPLEKAKKYVFSTRDEADKMIKYFEKLQAEGQYE